MKYLLYLSLFFLIFLLSPERSDAQITQSRSKSPVFESKSNFQPRSRSRPPGGTRRPLTPSRRSRATEPFGWEFGGNIGTSYSLTDVSGMSVDQRPSFLNTQWTTLSINAGAFSRYRFHEYFAVKASLNYGRIHGADSIAGRMDRNYSFHNNIFELGMAYEVYVPASPGFPVGIYGFVGLAAFYHNPVLIVPDPIGTGFSQDEYGKIQPAIPMGFGFNYSVTPDIRVGYEIGWRKTFFDYLDGFTRVWSKGSDSYYFGAVTVSYFLPTDKRW